MHLSLRARQGFSCLFESLETRRLLSATIKGAAFVGPVRPNVDRLPEPTIEEWLDTPSLALVPPTAPPTGPIDPDARVVPAATDRR